MKDENTNITAQLQQKIQAMLPSGIEIYNSIMKEIEPDLLAENIEGLDKKYAAESESDRKIRIQKYVKAVQEYDKVATVFFAKLDAAVEEHRADVEAKSTVDERGSIDTLESQLTDI